MDDVRTGSAEWVTTTNDSKLFNSQGQAQLLEAQSKILSLELEVSSLRQKLREENIRKGSSYVTEPKEKKQVSLVERCHKVSELK